MTALSAANVTPLIDVETTERSTPGAVVMATYDRAAATPHSVIATADTF